MSVSHQKQPFRTLKTLPKQCNTCLSHYRDCDCPKRWYDENIVPREQRLTIRFPENATIGTRFDACPLPIEAILLHAQFMNPITLLAMMQAFYPWIMPATFISHLRHNATRTYRVMHDFLLCLETGFISDTRYLTRSYGTLPTCIAFTCSPNHIVDSTSKHTCNCGFTYDIRRVLISSQCDSKNTIDFKYTKNYSDIPPSLKLSYTPKGCDNETFEVALGCKRILDPTVYLDEFTGTFDFWKGSRMGPYAHKYKDDEYEEYAYDAELETTQDTAFLIKVRVKTDNKSHDREKKAACAHKNARDSRAKRYCMKGRNTPNRHRDLSLV